MTSTFRLLLVLLLLMFSLPHLFFSAASEWLELQNLRLQFALRGEQPTPDTVTVVQIDPRSLRRSGLSAKTGYPIAELARALERIADADPKLVILDLGFYGDYSNVPANQAFEQALERVPTILARGITTYIDTDIQGAHTVDLEKLLPFKDFSDSAADTVLMMAPVDRNEVVAALNLSSYEHMVPLDRHPFLSPLRRFVSPEIEDPGDEALINYYGDHAIPNVPIYKLSSSEHAVSDAFFRDRVVFVGGVRLPDSNPNGGDDSFKTPLSTQPMYGVNILATIAQNLLDKSWIRQWPKLNEYEAHTYLATIYCMFLPALGHRRAWAVLLIVISLWTVGTWYLFSFHRWFLRGAMLIWLVLPAITVAFTAIRAFTCCRTRHQDANCVNT